MKKLLLIVSALLFVLSSCDKKDDSLKDYKGKDWKPEEEVSIPSNGFKLMSFNVRYEHNEDNSSNNWAYRKYAVYSMLGEQKPLVMGTQECLMSQRNDILQNVKFYRAFGGGRNTGKEDSNSDGESMSIFYLPDSLELVNCGTFWLSETPDAPGSKGWDAACIRCCTWGLFRHKRLDKSFYYFNTHLDHKGVTARTEEMKLLKAKMAEINSSGLPYALSADFNTTESDKIFNDIYTVMNSARSTAPSTDAAGSYNGYGASNKAIDHIFYTGFRVVQFRTVTASYAKVSYISDHYPVYAIFTLK